MPFTIDGDVEVRDTLSLMKDLGSGIYGEVLRLKDNIISTEFTDGDIQIAPNGSGDVYLGLIAGNSQITNVSNISISGNTITFPSSNTSDLTISTNGTTSAVKINNINISQGLAIEKKDKVKPSFLGKQTTARFDFTILDIKMLKEF